MKPARWIFLIAGIYGIAMAALYAQQRISSSIAASAVIDFALGLLFVIAFLRTPKTA